LANKAANDTLTTKDRDYIQSELNALSTEITRTAEVTEFNNQKLLDGSFTNKNLQVGSETEAKNQIEICIKEMSATNIGVDANSIQVTSHTDAKATMQKIKTALESVSTQRSDLGAIQNRLEHTIKNLDNVVENTQSAESLIRDTDMAEEMVRYSNNNILAQAGQSMLAQANQTNQGVLSLLQ
jgi:flagellin